MAGRIRCYWRNRITGIKRVPAGVHPGDIIRIYIIPGCRIDNWIIKESISILIIKLRYIKIKNHSDRTGTAGIIQGQGASRFSCAGQGCDRVPPCGSRVDPNKLKVIRELILDLNIAQGLTTSNVNCETVLAREIGTGGSFILGVAGTGICFLK